MRAHWAVAVIASILILGTLVTGLTPNAYAAQTLTIDEADLNLNTSKLHIKSTVSGFSPTDLDVFSVAYVLRNNANGELFAGFCLVDQGVGLECFSFDGINTVETTKMELKLNKMELHIDAVVTGFSTHNSGELELTVYLLCPNQEYGIGTAPVKIKG